MRKMAMRSGNSYFLPSPMLRQTAVSGGGAAAGTAEHKVKYILVTGGVCSSLGKGVTSSTIGALLRSEGYRVCSIKIDPYINVDAGLMSPFEHGEVYVLGDGGEVDLDLGNYERWMSTSLTREHNITTGKVYNTLIQRERQGKFLGKTVTLVPHFTNEVVEHIERVSRIPVDGSGQPPQICLIELGGTVGDLESAPFIEALRTLRFTIPPQDFCLMHCTYLPVMGGTQKTKPTQHSCRALLSLGLTADFLVCRSEQVIQDTTKEKLSQLCGIKSKYILGAHNLQSLYDVPALLADQGVVDKLRHKLHLDHDFPAVVPPMNFPNVETFKQFSQILRNPTKMVRIAFVGKYLQHGTDAYFSVLQAFEHCCISLGVGIEFLWIDSTYLEGVASEEQTEQVAQDLKVEAEAQLKTVDGIFVAGGFGKRGVDGKVRAAQIARECNIPYLGVCLGMQVAMIDIARNLLKLPNCHSEEFEPECENKIVIYMPEIDKGTMGANMRLGARDCYIIDKEEVVGTDSSSIIKGIYGGAKKLDKERHRHRYEFNMKYYQQMKDAGVIFSCVSDPALGEGCRVEGIELKKSLGLKFYLAVQFHPEFVTTPTDPSPPYLHFIAAAADMKATVHPGLNSRAEY